MTSTLHRTPLATAGLALVVALGGCGGRGGDSRETPPYVPKATTVDATTPAPAAEPLTIASPMFADGAPIPVQFSCKGANVAPPLTWSSPAGAAELALVVDDPDAVGGLYVHWIVTGIAPGSGSTADGQTPAGGHSVPNSGGRQGYFGPCPPAGTGTHHYRFTLYHLPVALQLPPGATGVQAAQAIAQAASGQARLVGTFEG
ncbi:YbhB/YbcL family Raf kinase inhibitor-like protein [Mycobacterium tuberculosis]|uniref:YbhB/YbcL family Raf kinase inhibitor-like protein n=1 Tax=Mycobacterium tuberculosis TaxID=1773 RepID=UPI000459855F|nr:YbhB/YbcL family Raf kinase inhibitor-like protein [Mycobacterium tuberculosis]KBG38656.1 lipoprotein LppC [Mycobacterium tuberculosis MAL010080]